MQTITTNRIKYSNYVGELTSCEPHHTLECGYFRNYSRPPEMNTGTKVVFER